MSNVTTQYDVALGHWQFGVTESYSVNNVLVGGKRVSGTAGGKDPDDALRRFVAGEARRRKIDVAAAIVTAQSAKGFKVTLNQPQASVAADTLLSDPGRDWTEWPAMRQRVSEATDEIKRLAAEAIRRSYATGTVSRKYDTHDVLLCLDSDARQQAWLWQAVGEDEDKLDKVTDEVHAELARREDAAQARKAKKIPGSPLGYLEKALKGTSWDEAVGIMAGNEHIHDNPVFVEGAWKAVWLAAHAGGMGVGFYGTQRLSDIPREKWPRHIDKVGDKVTVYRGTPSAGTPIVPGNYVTTARGMARGYVRGPLGGLSKASVDPGDLLVVSLDEQMPEYIYMPRGHKRHIAEPTETFREFWERHR